jgi:hypothetical protein
MYTADTFMNEAEENMNCLCVPSPQSKRIISEASWTATAVTLRFGEGRLPPVPRNTTRTRPYWPAEFKSLLFPLLRLLKFMKMIKPKMAMMVATYMQPW